MPETNQLFEFGPLRVDPVNRELTRGSTRIALTPRAFATLLALVEQGGRIVTKQRLLETVWPGTHVEPGTLTQNIYTLRKALADAGAPDCIETVPRRGYRFATPVSRILGAGEIGVRVMAVLPFLDLAGGTGDEFLGLCMADALITRLSSLRKFTVRPTSAILEYEGRKTDPLQVGRDLAVDAVLQGTVQRGGDRLRVNVQLVSVRDGSLWGEAFDVAFTDTFSAQDAISRRVADALKLQLTLEERQRLGMAAATNQDAHQAYVKGRYFWNKRSEAALTRAIEYFREALGHDASYAQAHAGLADSYALLPLYGDLRPHEAFPQAARAAEQALALDESVAEAHTSLAYTRFFYDWKWDQAEGSFRRAIELDPGYPTAYHWYCFLLSAMGRHDEAIARIKQAQDLDPLSLAIATDLGMAQYFRRRHEDAVEQFRRALELQPEFAYARFGLGLALVELGRHDEAVAESRQALELSGGNTAMQAALGHVLARAGNRTGSHGILGELRLRAERQHVQASRFALVHAGLNDVPAALEHLERAIDERSRFMVFAGVWPAFDPLRGDPAFAQLLERIGLPDAQGRPRR